MIFNAINLASQVAYNPIGQGIGYALYLVLERARLQNQTQAERIQFETMAGASKAVFARLGEIEFLMVEGITQFRESTSQHLATHETVLGKEVLQVMGARLRSVSITMTFHQFFGNPQDRLAQLRAACEDGKVRQLTFGNGIYDGKYVIESVETTVVQCALDGTPIYATADVVLKEYAEKTIATVERERRTPTPKPKPKPKKVVPFMPKSPVIAYVNGRAYPPEVVEVE